MRNQQKQMLGTAKIFSQLLIYAIVLACITGCKNTTKAGKNSDYELHIGVDESLKTVTTEIINLFNYYNPKLILTIDYNKAGTINDNFNNNCYDLIITPKQKSYNWKNLSNLSIYPKKEMLFQDALVFLISSKNSLANIDIKNLDRQAQNFNKIIFDSNINRDHYEYLIKINPGLKDNPKVYSATFNTENILGYLKENDLIVTNIAQILNDTKIEASGKLLAINSVKHSEEYISPSQENLINKKYPLVIEIFGVYKDTGPHLSKYFINFTLGQISQLVIHKYGLLPRKIYKRVIEINDKPFK